MVLRVIQSRHLIVPALFFAQQLFAQGLPAIGEYTPATGAEAIIGAASSRLRLGDLSGAEQMLRGHNTGDAHYLLGYILFRENRAKDSLAEYTEAARHRTPTAYDLKVVACDYVILGDFDDAAKWFSKVVEWAPGDIQGWYYLGRARYNQNEFDNAVKAFEQTLTLDPKNVKAMDNLGLCYQALNRFTEAAAAYKTAIDWQQGNAADAGPYLNLASLLVDTERPSEAVPLLQEAVRISSADPRIRKEFGKAYTRLNRLDEAKTELLKAAELAPKDAAVHFLLAQVYRKQGLNDQAKLERDRFTALNAAATSKQP
jgi:tetratricopeptide (TPR) repeat protein